MKKSSLLLAVALACGLMLPARGAALLDGRCEGQNGPDRPPADGPVWVPAVDAAFLENLPTWNKAGYRWDPANRRMTDPKGVAVDAARARWLLSPVDLSRTSVDGWLWQRLIDRREFDESSCHLRDENGSELSRLELLAAQEYLQRQIVQFGLENIRSQLAETAPRSALPAAVVQRLERYKNLGVALPNNLDRIYDGASAPKAGGVGWAVDAAYGRMSLGNAERDAWPELLESGARRTSLWPAPEPILRPSASEKASARLGRMIAAPLREGLSRNAAGRELLARLDESPRGEPELVVEKHSQSPKARMNSRALVRDARRISINFWHVREIIQESLPAGRPGFEAKEFSDAAATAKFLETRPWLVKKIADGLEVVASHELTHILQKRRTPYEDKAEGAKSPEIDPLEWEAEAFRNECRFVFLDAAARPEGFRGTHRVELCLILLQDHARFLEKIEEIYRPDPTGVQTIAEALDIQAQRKAMASRFAKTGGILGVAQNETLKDLRRGDIALSAMKRDANRSEADYFERLRPEILRTLVTQNVPLRVRADYGTRLAVILGMPEAQVDILADKLLKTPLKQIPATDRLNALQTLAARAQARGRLISEDLAAALRRDTSLVVGEILDAYDREEDPQERARLIALARSLSAGLPANDPFARRLRRQ